MGRPQKTRLQALCEAGFPEESIQLLKENLRSEEREVAAMAKRIAAKKDVEND